MTPDPHARRWAILAAVGAGTYLNVLDNAMLNVALPTIMTDLQTDVPTVQWVVVGYVLVVSSLLLTGGRLADVHGRRRMYLIGMVMFTAASVLAAFSADIYQLILFRMAQGVGSALVQGIGPAIITSAFSSSERGKALGFTATTVALGGISGPIFGGIIADALGWRWIFLARVPLALLIVGLTWRLLPPDRLERRDTRFDVAGAATFFLGLSALLLALNQGRLWGWSSPPILALLGCGLVLGIVFFRIERRAPQPMLALDVFRNRLFASASASGLLNFCAASHSFFMMPFLLVQGLGYSASQAGLLMVANMVMMSVAAPTAGALSDRFGSRVLSPIGAVMVCVALFALSRLGPESTAIDVMWRLGLLGLGMGTFNSPNNSAIMGAVTRDKIGLAAGIMASMRNVGNVVGVAIAGTVLTVQAAIYGGEMAAAGLTGAARESRALIFGIQDAFLVATGIAALAVAVSLVRGSAEPQSAPAPVTAGSAPGQV